MKKYTFLFFFCTFCGYFNIQAQIVSGELPPSFSTNYSALKVSEYVFHSKTKSIPKPNIKALQKEDAITDQYKNIPWRFGKLQKVNYNLKNAGEWFHYANGESMYRLNIKANDAVSLNLNFSKFQLSSSAKVFIYNQQKTDLLGAINANNNKKDSLFSTRPVYGSAITIELYVPREEIKENLFQIGGIVYGYRDFTTKENKAFGGSGSCEVDINCPEGDKWQDVKRSVVMVLTASNTRKCSGTLLNNTAMDSIPYLITAEHCGLSNNSIFVFNYESPQCKPASDPGIVQSISGATYRASAGITDFQLFELSQKPPASYQAYYSGWSALDTLFYNGTGIHHPKGDVKKISYCSDTILSDSYSQSFTNTHWKVSKWVYGSTEQGSSGSALFNEDQAFIGQLQGGSAVCGYELPDYYGKFSDSWDRKSQNHRQVAHWLDPINSNQKTLEGLDSKVPSYANDAKLIGIHALNSYRCDSLVDFIFNFKNKGRDSISKAKFVVKVNNKDSIISWNGLLKKNQVQKIRMNAVQLDAGDNEILVYTQEINDSLDQNPENDTARHQIFSNHHPIYVNLELKTDNYGSETAWNIKTPEGNSIYQGGYYTDKNGGKIFNYKLCLYDSCFTLNLLDLAGDGFNGFFGNGHAIISMGNDTLLYENNFTSASKSIPFCIDSATSIPEVKSDDAIIVYPNPISKNDILKIKNSKSINEIFIYNIEGQKVERYSTKNQKNIEINLPKTISKGLYILKMIKHDRRVEHKKILISE